MLLSYKNNFEKHPSMKSWREPVCIETITGARTLAHTDLTYLEQCILKQVIGGI